MLSIYPVDIDRELDRTHPLYVGHFFPLKGMWWRKRKQRQGLIISMAIAWYRLVRKNLNSPGFLEEEILITSLTRQVKDAKVILEKFFSVKRIGYNFDPNNKSPSIISPKRLNKKMQESIEAIFNEVYFSPGLPPIGKKYTKSEVYIQPTDSTTIIAELIRKGREDLIPPVAWLFKQTNGITFYFEPSGTLQARDKSVWPIRSIESWPGWLRRELFGTVIDIENAYVQFIVQKLEQKYQANPTRMQLKYRDLLRAHKDKKNFREELCTDYLRLPINDESLNVVKRLIMSLANGSNATPALLTSGSTRSDAVKIVHESCPHLSSLELMKLGSKLSAITKQFTSAKRDLCIFLLGEKPTRLNQKKIFKMYFEWERECRYKIWEMVGFTGVNTHDGLDGIVIDDYEGLTARVWERYGLRVKVENYKLPAKNTTNSIAKSNVLSLMPIV